MEIWLDPARRGSDWHRFVVNIRQARRDENNREGVAWNPAWEARVREEQNFFRYEIRIPWETFGLSGPPPEGTEWGINLVRNDIEPVRDPLALPPGRRQGRDRPDVFTWAKVDGDLERSGLYPIMRFTRREP